MKKDRCKVPYCRTPPTVEIADGAFGGPGAYCDPHNAQRLDTALAVFMANGGASR